MMSEWKEYNGSDEQIKELNEAINSSSKGVLLELKNGKQAIIRSHLYAYDFDAYLICNPHPRADMICQQARTGQPVWMLMTERQYWIMPLGEFEGKAHVNGKVMIKTTTPDWNIPNAEYSFTEFKDDRDRPEPSFHGDAI